MFALVHGLQTKVVLQHGERLTSQGPPVFPNARLSPGMTRRS